MTSHYNLLVRLNFLLLHSKIRVLKCRNKPMEIPEQASSRKTELGGESDVNYDIIETVDKEFRNLLLEENKHQYQVEEESEIRIEERDYPVQIENAKQDEWPGEEENQSRDGWNENEYEDDNREGEIVQVKERNKRSSYPVRPGEPDCVFYLKAGTCGFGYNCKFNHPPTNKQIKVRSAWPESEEPGQVVEEKAGCPRRVGLPDCKYYLTPGGCKYGKACRYHHPREKYVVGPPAEFNFLGLPIRPGESECPFYMRTGSCKFASNCRFHHPDPTAGGLDSGYEGSSSFPLHASSDSQPLVAPWSILLPATDSVPYSNPSGSYVPTMLHPQGRHSSLEWNEYQTPVNPLYPQERNVLPPMASLLNGLSKKPDGYSNPLYLQERNVHSPMASAMNGSNKNANGYSNPLYPQERIGLPPMASSLNGLEKNADGYLDHLQKLPVDEFPERPGQKECQYFLKTGDCKYKSACRFHHPKTQGPKSSTLSPLGLPLRPDQIVCVHFSRYGICKYGAACKYDHTPIPNSSGSVASGPGPLPYYNNSANLVGANMANGAHGSKAFVQ